MSRSNIFPHEIVGVCSGLTCHQDDVLALGGASAVGIVAKVFLRIDDTVVVCGHACERVRVETPHSQIWRAAKQLSLVPLDRVLARCTWAPHAPDLMLVLSSGL